MHFAETDSFTFALLILVGALLLGIAATMLFRSTVPAALARVFRTDAAERKYLDLSKEGYVVRDRVRTLQTEFNRLESAHNHSEAELRKIQRQVNNAATTIPDFIHEVGEPRAGQTRFVARLTVDASSPHIRTTSDSYNPIWHFVNLAEIWASSKEEARQTLDLAYSDKLGYVKVFIDSRLGSPGEPSR